MPFKFESLKVWRDALDLANEIDLLSRSFPKHELFSLRSQIKRAADSVVLNITEGCTGQSNAEFKRFLGIALRSAVEVVCCLFLAQTRNYLDEEKFREMYVGYEDLCKKITSLRKSM
jgi:four helix bundle protein